MTPNNPYPGINAHLNSALQARGDKYKSFHSAYLNRLFQVLDETLPAPYFVAPEESLQIQVYESEFQEKPSQTFRPGADVLISRDQHSPAASGLSGANSTTQTGLLTDWVAGADEQPFMSVVIYRDTDSEAVTRIELLSPANTPPGAHASSYRQKRRATLHAGIRLVEIDFLHTRHPVKPDLPDYSRKQTGAYPYHITVMNPRPTYEKGSYAFYGIDLLAPIPVVPVPLVGEERIMTDFGAIYDEVIQARFLQRLIDYSQPPVQFEKYTDADKHHIQKLMQSMES